MGRSRLVDCAAYDSDLVIYRMWISLLDYICSIGQLIENTYCVLKENAIHLQLERMRSGKLVALIIIKDSSIVSLAIISIPFLLLDQVSMPIDVFQGLFWL